MFLGILGGLKGVIFLSVFGGMYDIVYLKSKCSLVFMSNQHN